MDQKKTIEPFPAEFGVIVGTALGLSGRFPEAVLVGIAWFILRRIRPISPSTVVFVTAIVLAETLILVLTMLLSNLATIPLMLEVGAVLFVGLRLFFTEAKQWAYILLVYCGYVIAMRSLDLLHGLDRTFQIAAFAAIAVRFIMGCQLVLFIRGPIIPAVEPVAPVPPPLPDIPPIIQNETNAQLK